ncbi:hypothetical protein [Roseburia sp. 1XD42-69]|uniref:hypothetical protein n=1 Tax=Roseburia sp. 1XD42-69 TaxID=2320088 RepID=UPI000EA15B09|nr:hypothetical protein [Roseburia sp. 1XD42-69]RKJ60386.1 hypothetical protein D7Y06_23990 [Roseburia sp. 1XD42-69]
MDYVLDIAIPKKEIEAVKLNEKLMEWGDSAYSCSPPQYITNSNIIFEQIEDVKYFEEIVGKKISNEIVLLNLRSDVLFELEYAINSDNKELWKNELFLFLISFYKLSEFYILLIREDEKIKERHRIFDKEEISIKLFDTLKWSNPKDILLFKEKL